MRFLHFSDVHLEDGFGGVPWREMFSKRLIGFANLALRRRRKYRDNERKMASLAALIGQLDVDVVLCSGDYTAFGTDREFAYARRFIEPFFRAPLGFVSVPGNHDVYVADAVGRWERHFPELLVSDIPELQVDGHWPLVKLFGEHVAVVCVNSARPNTLLLSSGRVPDRQIEALRPTLEHAKVQGRFVFLMTHYAPRLPDGQPDHARHGLENADALLAALADVKRGALVHGHVHHCFHVRVPETPVVLFDAGSTTMAGREGFWLYDVSPTEAWATPGRWTGEQYEPEHDRRFAI